MAGCGEELVLASDSNKTVGTKKYFLFYTADGIRTNWVMEEYRLSGFGTSASTKTRNRQKQVRESNRNELLIRIGYFLWGFSLFLLLLIALIWLSITTYILTLRPSCFLDSWLAQDYSEWVICRVYERDLDEDDSGTDQLSCLDEVFLSMDDLDEISLPN